MIRYLNSHQIVFHLAILVALLIGHTAGSSQSVIMNSLDFDKGWKFFVGEQADALSENYNDSLWRMINLPHDGSIEGTFDLKNPSGPNEGYLPRGICIYRKKFFVRSEDKNKDIFIDFDGIYRNSEVWINGHYLGKRPNGYISFRYELTYHLKYGSKANYIVVKVDNSAQPNSRWYTGTGIYRNVRLVLSSKIHIDHWGVSIQSPTINRSSAVTTINTSGVNTTGL